LTNGVDTVGFPAEAAVREGTSLFWDYTLVDEWLRNRPVNSNGPTPRWLKIVDHPAVERARA
jgi:hypothetical protein